VQLQKAFLAEKQSNKLTQQEIATRLGVNRSVVNRQLKGEENLTVRSAAAFAWAMGCKLTFHVEKLQRGPGDNNLVADRISIGTGIPSSTIALVIAMGKHMTRDVNAWPTIQQQTPRPPQLLPGSETSNTASYIPTQT
jgi:transcriptional regulator with XRE-family HTH domain